jgi:hypothetical protein
MIDSEKTSLNALPFSMNTSIYGTVTASLQPRIPLGFQFFDGEVSATIAVFLDAPSLALNLTKTNDSSSALNLTMGPTNLNTVCMLDEHNMTTKLSQELILGVGLEAGIAFDLSKLNPNSKSGKWPALAALADGASLLRTATSTMLLNTTIAQTIGCLQTTAPTTSTNSSSSSTITPVPTTTQSSMSSSPIASTTIMNAQTKPNAAVSLNVMDVCTGMLVVVAMVFLTL